jgi:DNA-directed RNA polymerase specialized sigma24 family protein
MDSDGSITRWLGPLQDGDAGAAHELWQRYFVSLVQLARKRLRERQLAVADEEDVALSAFDSFCRCAEQGRFPDLADRDSLWRVLAVITARKASRLLRDESRQKRDSISGRAGTGGEGTAELLQQVVSQDPSPELAAQLTEEVERLLHLLGDDQLRQVALWRMEGHTVDEIAVRVGCAPRSVKRKLQLIRTLWENEAPP